MHNPEVIKVLAAPKLNKTTIRITIAIRARFVRLADKLWKKILLADIL